MKTFSFTIYKMLGLLVLMPLFCSAQGLTNTSGTHIVVNGAVSIVINNGGLSNAGSFTKSTGTVVFTGSNATSGSFIGGSSTTDFYNLTLNKSANGLQLNNHISVSNQITFTSGDSIFLNNYNVDLGSTGSLSGETSSKRFTGQTGGYIMITQNLNAPTAVNPGNLGMEITSAANLGSTVIKRMHTVYRNKSITRNFEIVPTNNAALNATLLFHYLHSEFRGNTETALSTYGSTNGGVNWNYMSCCLDLNTGGDFITTNNVQSLHLYTLFSFAELPVLLIYLKGKQVGADVQIDWATSGETDNDHFDIERSANGLSFSKIGTIKGSGSSTMQKNYQFLDEQPLPGTNYYRLKQVDNNDEFVYSGTISVLMSTTTASVNLSPNPANNLVFLKINSNDEGQTEMNLVDQNGKAYQSKSLKCVKGENNFILNIQELPKGIYYIRLTGSTNQTIKLLKM